MADPEPKPCPYCGTFTWADDCPKCERRIKPEPKPAPS